MARATRSMPSAASQFAVRRRLEQAAIRHRVPEEVRQAAGDLRSRGSAPPATAFGVKQEFRRLQHRLDDDPRAVEELAGLAGLRAEERRIPPHLRVGQRPAERAQAECLHELIAALRVASRRRFARHQPVDVAGAERIQRQFLGRGAVGLGQQRRHALRAQLVLEAVDEVLRRKPIGGPAVVAEQIANGVVVLAVRQPPQQLRGCRRGRGGRQPVPRGCHRRLWKRRQVLHPIA